MLVPRKWKDISRNVLLILAGITIMYVMGDNGVFGKASQAKIQTEIGMNSVNFKTGQGDYVKNSNQSTT